jgi:hypothetical protein
MSSNGRWDLTWRLKGYVHRVFSECTYEMCLHINSACERMCLFGKFRWNFFRVFMKDREKLYLCYGRICFVSSYFRIT